MSYSLDVDPLAQEQVGVLPSAALPALAEAFALLTLVPWNARRPIPVTLLERYG